MLAPAPLFFERRRWTAMFALPFALFMAVAGPATLLWLPGVVGRQLGIPLGIFFASMALALAASLGRAALVALREKGPALIVDARGITDNFHLKAHLPWSIIASTRVDYGGRNNLMLVLRPGARLPGGGVVQKGFWRSLRRAFNGGDLRIPLGGLVYDQRRLREALAAHLARRDSDEAR